MIWFNPFSSINKMVPEIKRTIKFIQIFCEWKELSKTIMIY